ncbi:hypothetical protein MML48_9g00003641 [Holotrichia oblita]|uniref:Uncharacterized protein n=1 Tax=Holotrichia oblita TaxID=644536 RepID=A0ACB9SJA4_HOLOL|nr:hypothetical protein MML48_9g00003641 [Holotrichia oblita]
MKTRTAINERDEDKIKSCVILIEEYVSQATLTSFKRCSNKEWDGSADNKSLFEFWNYIHSKTGSKQLNNNQEETTKPTMAEDHSNQNQIADNQEERDSSNQDVIADNQEESVAVNRKIIIISDITIRKEENKPIKQINEDSSDSSISVNLESEGEGDEWMEEDLNKDESKIDKAPVSLSTMKAGDYVIVKYNDKYFPGKVSAEQNNRVLVSVMTIAGLYNWKWPYPVDEIWYSEEEVIEQIPGPVAVNKRGNFKVVEIQKYSDYFEP